MFDRSKQGAVDVVVPRDPLNQESANEMGPVLDEILSTGQPRIVLDLARTPFMDSLGLEWLLELHERSRKRGGAVKLAGPTPLCQDILRVTGLDAQFEVFDDMLAAVGSFAQ